MCGAPLAVDNLNQPNPLLADRNTGSVGGVTRNPSSFGRLSDEHPSSPRHASLQRASSSYQLLLCLQEAGPAWRDLEGLSDGGCFSPGSVHSGRASFNMGHVRSEGRESLAEQRKDEIVPNESAAKGNDKEQSLLPSQARWGVERDHFLSTSVTSPNPRNASFPRILCVARRYLRKNKYVDITGEFHLDLIQSNGGAPVILPRTTKTIEQMTEYLPMDGLVIAEGNDLSDDILLKYGCTLPDRLDAEAALKWASDTELDVSKDALEFALMRFALAAGVPIMSFCRGSQMLNVLRGGSLIGDISSQTDSEIPHARDSSEADYDSYRHPIDVTPNTPLAGWFADSLQGTSTLHVNSYHHQASKELGTGLVEMARSPDGMIEGFYDADYDPKGGKFVVGLQFHPERMLEDYPGCSRCYEDFMVACHAYKASQDGSA